MTYNEERHGLPVEEVLLAHDKRHKHEHHAGVLQENLGNFFNIFQ